MVTKFYVYVYLRIDGSPYYVGKGTGRRWKRAHGVEVPSPDRVIFIITETTEEWAHFMEMELIDLYGRLNDGTGILENWTDGGDGGRGCPMSEETKQKISKLHKGIKKGTMSKETKQKISDALKGRKCTENHRQNIIKSLKGRTLSVETKQKIRESNRGLTRPESVRKKMSESAKGRKLTEETKQKISESLKQRNRTDQPVEEVAQVVPF